MDNVELNRESMILALMSKITSKEDLKSVLDIVVQDAPKIVGAVNCLIYWQPQYVSKYSESLSSKTTKSNRSLGEENENMIVLAATNQESKQLIVGNVYFAIAEGITGWVYENGKSILIHNVTDTEELKRISYRLSWINKIDADQIDDRMHSILAIPLKVENEIIGTLEFYGVVSDSTLSEASGLVIANFLALVINNLYVYRSRKQFLMSLAHEMNTPLTGILADAENLYQELPKDTEFYQIAKHIFGQVLRLHMQTATLMAVLSEQATTRQFSEHSIYRPLKEACELFESEALQKGLEILGPKARDGNFPTIEMSLFDLTIAFKNIIHNAVKYSYVPPVNSDSRRTIKVWGQWDNNKKGYYSIFIQNYGVGIIPFEIEKRLIFQPYYRGEKASDRRRAGAGLGLAHARNVIEDLHHGHISVTSTPQGGDAFLTTFTISLPVKQPVIKNGGLDE